jgi:ribosomal protein L16
MLMPKKTKYRKSHRGRRKGNSKGGNTVNFGDYGIQAVETSYVTGRQIEAARITITRTMKRGGKVWINIFPHKPVTQKPAEVRMGSGKGNVEYYVAVVKPGRIIFEISGVPEDVAREAMRKAGHKLPMKTKFVTEPWKLPASSELEEIGTNLTSSLNTDEGFMPFLRDVDTFARPWAVPGTPGLEHRVGGLEKEEGTGNVSYDSANHQYMTDMRAWKVANIANDIEKLSIHGDEEADTLVLGWGSTYGGITQAVNRLNAKGVKVASAHFVHLNPFPDNTLEVLSKFKQIIIPELNTGQLLKLIREAFLIDAKGINKVAGVPFTAQELADKIEEMINE